jgi:retron-type reverse transcriptase
MPRVPGGTLPDRYLALHDLGVAQRQAGVDKEVAELVVAYGRLRLDSGEPVGFDFAAADPASAEERLYDDLSVMNPGGDQRFLRFLAAYGALLAEHGVPPIFSTAHLARRLRMSRGALFRIAAQATNYYRELRMPKPAGGERVIHAPFGRLLELQRSIAQEVLGQASMHPAAHAFVRRRSIVTNVRPHEGHRVVMRIDLEDFFPSITTAAVRRAIEKLGYPYSVASALARLCTLEGRLPQGAPTSPALSNLVGLRLDRRFAALSVRLGFVYTRYADDLVLSSDDPRLPSLLPFFREVIGSEGFRVNERKTRVMRPGNAQTVTGLVANVHTALPRERRRKLRAILHRLRTRGPAAVRLRSRRGGTADPLQVLEGHLAFARMVDAVKALAL